MIDACSLAVLIGALRSYLKSYSHIGQSATSNLGWIVSLSKRDKSCRTLSRLSYPCRASHSARTFDICFAIHKLVCWRIFCLFGIAHQGPSVIRIWNQKLSSTCWGKLRVVRKPFYIVLDRFDRRLESHGEMARLKVHSSIRPTRPVALGQSFDCFLHLHNFSLDQCWVKNLRSLLGCRHSLESVIYPYKCPRGEGTPFAI